MSNTQPCEEHPDPLRNAETTPQIQSLLRQAQEALADENFSHANHLYTEILKADPTYVTAREGKLDVLLRWGYRDLSRRRYDEAHDHFTRALEFEPSSTRAKKGQVESLIQWGNRELAHDRNEEAQHLHMRALEIDPSSAVRVPSHRSSSTPVADMPPPESRLHVDPSNPPVAVIRDLLEEAFTERTLRRFCQDHSSFRDLLSRFSTSDGLADLVDKVIEYCRQFLLWDDLLAEVKKVNPRQYARFEGQLPSSGEAGQASSTPAAPSETATGGTTYVTHIQHAQGIAIGDGAQVIRADKSHASTPATRSIPYDDLAEAEENLRLIRERKSQYVLEVDIPLQLIKEERRLLTRIAELKKESR